MSILQAPPNAMIVHLENIVRKVHPGSLGTVIQATFVLAEQVLQLHQAPSLSILTQQHIMVFAQLATIVLMAQVTQENVYLVRTKTN